MVYLQHFLIHIMVLSVHGILTTFPDTYHGSVYLQHFPHVLGQILVAMQSVLHIFGITDDNCLHAILSISKQTDGWALIFIEAGAK